MWNDMGNSYSNLKKYKRAIECYEKAVEINPNHSKALNNLSDIKKILRGRKFIEEHEDLEDKDDNILLKQLLGPEVIKIKKSDKAEVLPKQPLKPEVIKQLENSEGNQNVIKPDQIFVGCAGIWEVNTLNFKVKVQNNTKYSITDIKVILDKHPSMLQLAALSNIVKTTHKLGPNGEFWSPEFQLNAGNACVSGTIRAIVRYYDHEERDHTINLRPYEISYICPLLEAKKINEENYLKKKKNMYSQEQQLIFEPISDLDQFKEEMKEKMEGMNLAVIDLKGSESNMVGYAEDKFHHDGLGLEAKIESMLDGQTEILLNLKAICEREDKCSPLLYKTLQELSTLGLSVEKGHIMQKLDMFIERPNDLTRYITRVIKSEWPEAKKDKWAEVIKDILEDWKEFKPKKWQKIAKVILKIVLGKVVGEELSEYFTVGFQNLIEWIKTNLS